jgi:hypothetical protein
MLPHAVYTGVQMLEIRPKTAILCNFLGAFGAVPGRVGSLDKALQDHEIGHNLMPATRSQNRVA